MLILNLIEKIPGAFWGVVVGSFFSLGGVILTNRSDRRNRERDRELSLRRDVYLSAVEAVSAGFMSVLRLADLDVPDRETTAEYIQKSPSIAKLQIVAPEKTMKAVTNFGIETGAALLKLHLRRIPLIAQKQQIAKLTQETGGAQQERAEAEKAFYGAWLTYLEECSAEAVKLADLMTPCVVSARRDLGMPLEDDAGYRHMVEEGLRRQQEQLQEYLSGIRQLGQGGAT